LALYGGQIKYIIRITLLIARKEVIKPQLGHIQIVLKAILRTAYELLCERVLGEL
jgi:hypothetical protein